MQEIDTFEPQKLIGKKIFFQCQDQSVKPTILELGEITKHYKLYKRSWTYIGRGDLIIFKLINSNYEEHGFRFQEIKALIEKNIFQDRHGLEYRIVN